MKLQEKTYLISFLFLAVCLAVTGLIYLYTGQIIIAILFAPPIVHWILKKRQSQPRDGKS